jgi:hypothetical protein
MRLVLAIVLMFLSSVPVSADNRPNCDEFTTRAEFVEYLTDTQSIAEYDRDDDGIACESTWEVRENEVQIPETPKIPPLLIRIGAS